MALKPVESNIVSLIVDQSRRVLDAIGDAADIATVFAELGIADSLTNNDLDAGGFKFTKAQLADALAVLATLNTTLDAPAKAKLYRVAAPRKLRM